MGDLMEKTLITGGAGFVGNNLARLIKPSILLDWRKPGYLFDREGELIFDDCEFIYGDVRDTDDLEKCAEESDVGSVIHLAAIPGVKRVEGEPKLAEEINVGGTENVLDFARENDVSNLIFASSAGVYGEIKEHPITEKHPREPLNLYSKMKLKGEKLCREYSEKYGLSVEVMRMSNLYGPGFRVKPNLTVIPRFVLRALSNQALTVYGDGEQTRDFLHVKDVAQACRRGIELDGGTCEVFNLGSGNTTSINELADVIVELMEGLYERDTEVEHVEPPEWRDEARERFDYSVEKLVENLDYSPEYSLREGVEEIITL